MNKAALAQLFYREVEKISHNTECSASTKIESLYQLMSKIFVEATVKERLQFSTLFSRIVYASQTYHLDRRLQLHVHHFRKAAKSVVFEGQKKGIDAILAAGQNVIPRLIRALFETPYPDYIVQLLPSTFSLTVSEVEVVAFHPNLRVVVVEEDRSTECLIAQTEARPTEQIKVQYNIPERNEIFNPSIQAIREVFGFPVTVNLLDVEVDKEGLYRPRAFVLEPDYLMDVSAVAHCFNDWGAEPLLYLLKKFLPMPVNKHLVLGNIANFFLDALMTNPNINFKATFPKVFQYNPLAFCLFEDKEIREIYETAQRHYVVLKRMVLQDFQAEEIQPTEAYLEPSFYSELYGLQGRLDVFYHSEDRSAIVELKSGKAYKPNQYGISRSHFVQTLLYDLLIQSVFGRTTDPKNYILYSSSIQKPLRFAPRIKAQQFEALQIRNQLVRIDWELKNSTKLLSRYGLKPEQLDRPNLLGKLSINRFAHVRGFLAEDIARFEKTYRGGSVLEQKYFNAFAGFIAREHQLAKTGVQGVDQLNGLASLWLNEFQEKDQQYKLLSHLKIVENQSSEEDPIIYFQRTERTNALANFRNGDIVVLYPLVQAKTNRAPILSHQIFKCTILEITPKSLVIKLRSQQFNTSIFEEYTHWNLEPDMLDSSFTGMYRSLFQFLEAPIGKRKLLLAQQAPPKSEDKHIEAPTDLTAEQQQLFQKALNAKAYFLLWGPPGTGKTSMMLKHLVAHLYYQTAENILLLAYTNRAVDEMCEAIEDIDASIPSAYIRIGSRFSTAEKFLPRLLQSKIENVNNRQGIKAILSQHRIFIGTVSSVLNKPELFQLKTFHRAIIDEASQILEPYLVGLLPYLKKFILIGDHRQLPAVVMQDERESAIKDHDLNKIGLKNLRNSLFERLYLQCIKNDWHWAYAQLSHQGRMHQDIMAFPNQYFYQNSLNILPETIKAHQKQLQAIDLKSPAEQTLLQLLCQHRTVFLPTPTDEQSVNGKTNLAEALLIKDLILAFQGLYQSNHKNFSERSIGVITPYRAQIAQIREVLEQHEIDLSTITVDTVERYQGGSREIIILSLCVNTAAQLQNLVSLSDEGVDRKLNVALTRAKQHLIVLGNAQLLRLNATYRALVENFASEKELEVESTISLK